MKTLVVIDPAGAEQRIPLTPLPFKIGKKPDGNDLVLSAINISREHCILSEQDGNMILTDLNSRNGTYVNGRKITGAEPVRDGDAIRVGAYTLRYYSGRLPAEAPKGAAPERRRTPISLKKKLHEEVLSTLDLKHSDLADKTHEEIREKTMAAARQAVAKFRTEVPLWLASEALVKEVVDEAVGLGPIEDLLADDQVDEIMVNGWQAVYVERRGKIELTDKQFTGDEQVIAIIRRILAPIGRRIDESSPMVDARLADGSRVNAIIPPLSLTGPTLTIRKFARTPYTWDDLIRFNSVSQNMVDFMRLAVVNRRNCLISGGTGSGKTTLLNVLSGFIPPEERIITIEDSAELQLKQEHVVSLETKPPSIEGKGDVPIRKLVINSLRMRPDRIIVGECRGGEALDMLQAMNTGHDGSLTTLHANSPRDVLSRLETMVLMAGLELPTRAIREQITSAVSLIVHGARLPDGTRKITEISEITGMEGDTIIMQTIFEFKQKGYDAEGRVVGGFRATGAVPKFVGTLIERGIEVDMKLFQPPAGEAAS